MEELAYQKLDYKYDKLVQSFNAFKRSFDLYTTKYQSAELAEQEAYVASLIKHFELVYEMLWKYLKQLLLEEYGIETIGSKTIFRMAYDQEVISEEQLTLLLRMVEIRNVASHVYDEEIIEQLCKEILVYYHVIVTVIAQVKPAES